MGVQGVRGLEHGRLAPRPSVGQAQALEHLVGAVGDKDLLSGHAVQAAQGFTQVRGGPVRVAVEGDVPRLGQ